MRATRFFDEVLRETRALPGVEAAGAINGLPLMGEIWGKSVTLFDRPLPATYAQLPTIQYRVVAGDYFRAMGVPIVTGRAFTEADTEPAAKVAIVNQTLARQHWPDKDPLGKEIAVNPPAHLLTPGSVPPDYEPTRLTIVGVAGDVRYGALSAAPRPLVYTPYAQGAEGAITMFLVVRAAENAGDLMPAIRDRLRRVDPDIPASSVRTMEARAAAALAAPLLQTRILGAFAGLALLLSATGIYGVTSYTARQRTREVGIRMAVGAGSRSILALFLRQGVALVGIGLVAGLAGAALLTRSLQALLFDVSATDPFVFVAITAMLFAVALTAAWLPARRATRLDPVVALRED
jgi:putative ABC transport system permease protein